MRRNADPVIDTLIKPPKPCGPEDDPYTEPLPATWTDGARLRPTGAADSDRLVAASLNLHRD